MARRSLPEDYDIVWDSPSENPKDSMPCGGGDIGLNVWVQDNSILFYAMRSGTFDENNSFPKIGRFRLNFPSINLSNSSYFEQRLQLGKGSVVITSRNDPDEVVEVHIWVDVFNPVIHIDITSKNATVLCAQYESWRGYDKPYSLEEQLETEFGQIPDLNLVKKKDEVNFCQNGVLFYHRNSDITSFDYTVKQQKLDRISNHLFNPLANLTYGGRISGSELVPAGIEKNVYENTPFIAWKLMSSVAKTDHKLAIGIHVNQTDSLKQWQDELESIMEPTLSMTSAPSEEWWSQFWTRSYIYINPENCSSPEWKIGRNYQLFRYMLGCNTFGSYPTKFNGGLFTFDPYFVDPKYCFTPDFRRWGGGVFTAQNQRLLYWPMLKSGDTDMIEALFDFYLRLLNTARIRAKQYFGVLGAYFNEQINNYGLENPFDWINTKVIYGRDPPADWPIGVEWNDWLAYSWDTILEIDFMILEAHRFGSIDIAPYLPLIRDSVRFFDEYYRLEYAKQNHNSLNQHNHLVLYPGSALETYKSTYNSITTISGLKSVITGVLELPSQLLDTELKTYFEQLSKRIPPLPTRQCGSHTVLEPAVAFDRIQNVEMPQLYPVFPYGIYGVGRPNISYAIDTYNLDPEIQGFKSHIGWKQDNIFCARMGLTEKAAEFTSMKLADSTNTRFPTFWGPGFDWTPDHNWGGSGMIGLQEMLLQTNGDSIILLPSWPKHWTVDFKLHASFSTTVEAHVENGVISNLVVEPNERLKNVVFWPDQH